jgi:flagellar hook-associated protein 3 FlgL
MSAFDTAITVNQRAGDDARTLSAHLTDADVIEANTELALAQRALEASLTATSQSFKLTLMNYLK